MTLPSSEHPRPHPASGKSDLVICRCEEVLAGEIQEAIRDGARSVTDVKRRTRAGMGYCQGKTCSRLVAGILARETGVSPGQVEPATFRPPARPIPLAALANMALPAGDE